MSIKSILYRSETYIKYKMKKLLLYDECTFTHIAKVKFYELYQTTMTRGLSDSIFDKYSRSSSLRCENHVNLVYWYMGFII